MSEQILVIDDDDDTAKLISLMLRRQGYSVLTANAGIPGLEMALEQQPDLVLLDVMMPDMDGLEVCRRLRAEPETANTPIIMFTAKALSEDMAAGMEAGVTDYLPKPTHPIELAARVKKALQQAPRGADLPAGVKLGEGDQTIGFVGAKGGIGTTSLAAGVGAVLARNHNVILTDIRPGQGTLGTSLGLPADAGVRSVLKLPANQINQSVISSHLVKHKSNLQLLLSSPNPQEFTVQYSPEGTIALKNALKPLAQFCLFDLGTGLTPTTAPLMRELDKIVVLTESDVMSLTTASSVLTVLETRIPKEKIQLVIYNRVQSSYQLSQQEIETRLGHSVAVTIPPAPDIALQATEAGEALSQFQPDAAVAKEIGKLVAVLAQ